MISEKEIILTNWDDEITIEKPPPDMPTQIVNSKILKEIQYIKIKEIPKKKRGRPKKKREPDPPYCPFSAKKKPKKALKKSDENEPKRNRGRPKNIPVKFGFQSIIGELNSIKLPSKAWCVRASITSEENRICFLKPSKNISVSVPAKCDKSVKLIGNMNYFVTMDNRLVELIAAPKTVGSSNDIEILLDIVENIKMPDPMVRLR